MRDERSEPRRGSRAYQPVKRGSCGRTSSTAPAPSSDVLIYMCDRSTLKRKYLVVQPEMGACPGMPRATEQLMRVPDLRAYQLGELVDVQCVLSVSVQ